MRTRGRPVHRCRRRFRAQRQHVFMDSPQHIGDMTTSSIQNQLRGTHLSATCLTLISSAVYAGQKFIQLNLKVGENDAKTDAKNDAKDTINPTIVILRRVQDSFVNVSQLFTILVRLGHSTPDQVSSFLANEILSSSHYAGSIDGSVFYNDFRTHENPMLQGLWVSYDRAVALALRFDIYEFAKKLFLIDVHDYDRLPKQEKRSLADGDGVDVAAGSPKKRKALDAKPTSENSTNNSKNSAAGSVAAISISTNYPFAEPPLSLDDKNDDLVSSIKAKYGEVFNSDVAATTESIHNIFEPIMSRHQSHLLSVTDIPLDLNGKTALHFAATLAATNLVGAFVGLGLTSPIRGTSDGETPLVSAITVTNAMEKGNFSTLLKNWLYPCLWLVDNQRRSVLHHLASQASAKPDSTRAYTNQIIDYIVQTGGLRRFCEDIVPGQEDTHGNTSLHIAAETEARWLVQVLVELRADVNVANKQGIKPIDFDIVKDVVRGSSVEKGDYIIELIRSGLEVMDKNRELGIHDTDPQKPSQPANGHPPSQTPESASGKIFNSIQELLASTSQEYESVIESKKQLVNELNKALRDLTIVTANNRFISRKVADNLAYLDNLKLQLNNINEKITTTKQEVPDANISDDDDADFDADEPFRIRSLYDKLGETDEIDEPSPEIIGELPSAAVLQARIKAYEDINSTMETELKALTDYSQLTAKFKKVVSHCTGVPIDEVDELLDGLLDTVEAQQ